MSEGTEQTCVPASPELRDHVLRARAISKSFGDRRVLRGVGMNIRSGEIHGLLGQNGSGKSTFIKILSGYHTPDPDAWLEIAGKQVSLPLKHGQSRELGIAFVHQDLGLFERASVLENVRLGDYRTHFGWRVSWREERRLVNEQLRGFGIPVDADTLISLVKPVDRAMVAIVRSLLQLRHSQNGGRLLVLDEPTPHLARDGVERLFDMIRQTTSVGISVLFVSHRLEEIHALTDRVTILRDGEVVIGGAPTAPLSNDDIVEAILGFSLDHLYPEEHSPRQDVHVSVRRLESREAHDVSFEVRSGEILGLTGLMGMGWERVPYTIFGAEPAKRGSLVIHEHGVEVQLSEFSPRQAIAAGFALLPGDRLNQASLQSASVAENITLPTLGSFSLHGILRHGQELTRASELMEEFDVRPRTPTAPLSTLSGGNQQKALLAKWFSAKPRVLLLHEPTQGVDPGAKSQILKRMRDAAAEGTAIVLASAEYEDLAHLCDRVLVFHNGMVRAELQGANLTHERIVQQAFAAARGTSRSGVEPRLLE